MSVLSFTIIVAIAFGLIAVKQGVVDKWQLPHSITARKVLRMSLSMCLMAIITTILLLAGVMWLIAALLGGVVGFLLLTWLIRKMEYANN